MIRLGRSVTGQQELQAVKSALERGYYGHAEKVVEFEQALSDFFEGADVVAVSSGTAALHLALDALGIGPGDEVIVPSLTFVASFQAVSATGARPIACDITADTLLMDLEDVQRRITSRTRALMPVHYAGQVCDLDGLLALARAYGLRIVEDAAHAFGSTYQGRRVGAKGDIACFSFDSLKTITCGEGGAIVTRDGSVSELCGRKRLLNIERKDPHLTGTTQEAGYQVKGQGYRYHMSNLFASIGLVQLGKAEDFIQRRREICRMYQKGMAGLPELAFLPWNLEETAPFCFVIRVLDGRRDSLMAFLKGRGVESGINYLPNHLQPYYRTDYGLPVTEEACGQILSLPLHCALSNNDVDTVTQAVRDFFK